MDILTVDGLSKSYRGGALAVSEMYYALGEGRILGLLGPNGSGKTTLLKCIAGLLTPERGFATVCGEKIGVATKSLVAYLPDRNFLCEWMTVERFLTYTGDFFPDFDRARAEEMISRLNISLKTTIKTLSKGNKEKLALIVTMSRNAKLYLLDEPIAGVDPAAREYVISTVLNNFSPHSSVIISTHLIADVEPVLTDVLFLSHGIITLAGEADVVRKQTGMTIDELFREEFRC